MIDAHIHLDQYDNIEKEIDKWRLSGIKGVIAVSNDLASSYRTLELQMKYKDFIYAAVGFHPEGQLPSEAEFQEWERLIETGRERITAIGEIGLPYYNLEKLPHSIEQSIELLSKCLAIAYDKNLPVALHAIHDKAKIVFDLLQKYQIINAHFHWLKAPKDVLDLIIKKGYYISVTPEVCYRNRDQQLASLVPLNQLMIETDGPWAYSGPFEEQATTSLFLKEVISKIADIKGSPIEPIQQQILKNTHLCYKLSENV